MKMFAKWMAVPFVALTMMISAVAPARAADEVQPAVVVSIAGVDEILGDIGYLTSSAGAPEVGNFVKLIAGQFTQGLDAKKPAGVYMTFVNDEPISVGFLPVKNLDLVLGNLKDQLGEPEDLGDGVLELGSDRPQPMYLKKQGDWAYFSNQQGSLSDLPADPAKLLGELPASYDIAVQVHVRNIPAHMRDLAIAEMKKGFERGMENQLDEQPNREIVEKLGRNSLESITMLVEGGEQILIGLNVDQESGSTYIDVSMTAVEGSELAKQIATSHGVKSQHTGFLLPDAAANLHYATRIADRDIEQTTLMIQAMRQGAQDELAKDDDLKTPEAKAQAAEVVNTFFDVAEQTIKDGLMNGGAVLMLNDESLNFAAGGLVSDGKKVESGFRKLVDLAKNEPDFPGVKFDAENYKDYAFHTMSVPIPEKEGEARKVFGARLDVSLAVAPKSVYIGFGNGNIDLLKKVIDASATAADAELPIFQMIVSVVPMLEFASSVDESNATLMTLASSAKDLSNNDSVLMTGSLIERGAKYRFEIEEGVLKIIGQAVQMNRQRQANF